MSLPIKGKITNIIDQYTIAINIGQNQNVTKGMIFKIIAKVVEIKDPDTKEVLGQIEIEKDRVQIYQVQEKFSLAETIGTVRESIGPMYSFAQIVQKKLTGATPEVDRTIHVGDEVVQVVIPPAAAP